MQKEAPKKQHLLQKYLKSFSKNYTAGSLPENLPHKAL
jgi:hypothetical protein